MKSCRRLGMELLRMDLLKDTCICLLSIIISPMCLRVFRGRLLMPMLLLSRRTDGLQVIGGSVSVVVGANVTLPCKLTDSKETLKQVLWQRSTRGSPPNDNFFNVLEKNGIFSFELSDSRFKFVGNFTEKNGSLQLSNAALLDEGRYSCIFLLVESGNHKTQVSLTILVPPVTNLKYESLTLGSEEFLLATCTATAAKPPAEVKWVTGSTTFRETINSTRHTNDTTTTISSLFGVPTREIDGQRIQCVISSAALDSDKIQNFTLQIFFSPSQVSFIATSDDSLRCVTEARPEPIFTWNRSKQALPPDVRAEGPELKFLSRSLDQKGLYQCVASNHYGKQSGQIFVQMVSVASPICTAGWILFWLSLLLNVAAGFFFLFRFRYGTKRKMFFRRVPTSELTTVGDATLAAAEREDEL